MAAGNILEVLKGNFKVEEKLWAIQVYFNVSCKILDSKQAKAFKTGNVKKLLDSVEQRHKVYVDVIKILGKDSHATA